MLILNHFYFHFQQNFDRSHLNKNNTDANHFCSYKKNCICKINAFVCVC